MGEADEPPLRTDRIQSGAKSHAFGKNPKPLTTYKQPQARSLDPTAGHDVPGTAPPRPTTNSNVSKRALPLSEKHNVEIDNASKTTSNETSDGRSTKLPPPAPPPQDAKEESSQSSALTPDGPKPSWPKRMKAGSVRFVHHTKDAICHSWLNVLLIFVPIGIAVNYAPLPEHSHATIVFAMNAIAIIPLAGLLAHATESVASTMGDSLAALLNVTFGNAVELIIFILALAKNQISIVQASILGSILANLLLILGMAFTLGGLRFQEQVYNKTVTQMSAVLLAISSMSLLLPTAFHASFSDFDVAEDKTLQISRGTSVILLLVYILYLLFQLKSHAYMYKSKTDADIEAEEGANPGLLSEMMNGSSSESSSSSDSDSDTSADSHFTARRGLKKVRKAFKGRRKSNASSTIASASALSSPLGEPGSALESGSPSSGSYFERHRRDTNHSAVFSGEDGDTDGEQDRSNTRIRDFQDENDKRERRLSKLSLSRRSKKQHKKHRKEKRSKRAQQEIPLTMTESPAPINEETSTQDASGSRPAEPHVGFADNVDGQGGVQNAAQGSTLSPRSRPFAITRQSFRPPLPNPFANTVFSTPAPEPHGSTVPGTLALARNARIRRTNSLPDRLNQQTSGSSTVPAHRSGALAMNQADVIGRDRASDEEKKPVMSRTAAVMLLLVSTGLVAFCAELLVDAIPEMVADTSVSEAFIGLIILPIVGNAAEHVTAVAVAAKNKMDLAIGVAIGSSIQIALFITPVVVLLGWIMDKDMSLLFTLFETVSLFVTVFVVNFLIQDGRSNYLEGALLMAAYIIIAVGAFFYPSVDQQSSIGGGSNDSGETVAALLRMF